MSVYFNRVQENWLRSHEEKQERILKEQLQVQLDKTPLVSFLDLTRQLFEKVGIGPITYERKEPIGNIDIRGEVHLHGLLKEEYFVALFHGPVKQTEVLHQVVHLLETENRKGILLTNSYFSDEVKKLSRNIGWQGHLVDGRTFAELLIRHRIGFTERQTSIYVLEEEAL